MPVNKERQLTQTFIQSAVAVGRHYQGLGNQDGHGLGALAEAIAYEGLVILGSSERYDQDLGTATRNAMNRPFGIELNTLSPNLKLLLYPSMIFQPTAEYIRQARTELDIEVKTEGPQAMLYVLNGFTKEREQVENLTANLLFVGHMVDALLAGRYPLETEERSPEFLQQVKGGLDETRRYIEMLDIATRAKLTPRIARLGILDDEGLAREARNYVLYQVDPLKMPGLYESPREDILEASPVDAVNNGTQYLHISERDLPLRVLNKRKPDVPALPWQEYGSNRWNRSHQLFGRFEAPLSDVLLRVDFRLDSTHMPALYGFFDTIEITRVTEASIREHIIFGQEMGEKAGLSFAQFFGAGLTPDQLQDSVIPIIIAGDFDFTNSKTQELLGKLAADKGTKPDVGRVITDILRLSEQGKLRKI